MRYNWNSIITAVSYMTDERGCTSLKGNGFSVEREGGDIFVHMTEGDYPDITRHTEVIPPTPENPIPVAATMTPENPTPINDTVVTNHVFTATPVPAEASEGASTETSTGVPVGPSEGVSTGQ